jgi:hypothetical protein
MNKNEELPIKKKKGKRNFYFVSSLIISSIVIK